LTPKMAKKKRTLVKSPDYANHKTSRENQDELSLYIFTVRPTL